MTDNETNLTLLNVNQIVSLLSRAYIKLIKNGTPLKSFPSVMLWGPPGIGKSQGVREIAGNIQAKTGKKVSITDVRLLLFNPVDLRGIPTTNADKTLSVWLKPQIFQMDESEDVINILFLDEITAAPQSVQAAAYQITLDRVIGEHKLPENCIVIAAGNRVTDKSVAYNMPRALANRLLHITVKGDPDSWHDWAVKSGIHRFVTSFLEYNPTALMRSDSPESTLAFPTPRSWEMVSNILTNISENMDAIQPLISGCIGASVTYNFAKWCTLFSNLPSIEDIFAGKKTAVEKSPEMQEALRAEMVAYAKHWAARAVRHDENFARPGYHIDGDPAEHLLLGLRDIGVAGADDLVDARHRLRAVGQRRDRLRAAELEHPVDARDPGRGQNGRTDASVGGGRRDHHDLAAAGKLGGDRIHQDG